MQALNLYATIEEYLDFNEEISHLYNSIKDIAVSKKPKTLIDIGCGQGEFCKLMTSYGIDTSGVDLSSKQIDIAISKGVKAQCIDIKEIDTKYDCATAVFDVINYIPKAYIYDFLSASYNLLNDDGYFIFDINSFFGFSEVAQGTLNIDVNEKFIAIDANFDDHTLFTDINLFTKLNEHYKKDFGTIEQFYYKNSELKSILEDIGFKVEEIKEFNLHSDEDADKYIFICKKEIK
ncbi:MAG: class I SAM-dependent methyltransferase [Campylobacterota bacterium]|nr:class I SAM-dependent methyltransferase [Campylobacterota bacterium]